MLKRFLKKIFNLLEDVKNDIKKNKITNINNHCLLIEDVPPTEKIVDIILIITKQDIHFDINKHIYECIYLGKATKFELVVSNGIASISSDNEVFINEVYQFLKKYYY